MTESTALARRKGRSLRLVTAASGAFGALSAVILGALLVLLTGGGNVLVYFIALFAVVVGAAGGWLLGRLFSPSDAEDAP